MKKKILSFTLSIAIILTLASTTTFAAETQPNNPKETLNPILSSISDVANNTELKAYNTIRYKKQNVKKYQSWGSYRRVSQNIKTGPQGGSITCSQSITFSTQVSGSIYGLGLSVGTSISNSIGHTINVAGNKTAYMRCKVLYNVEEGTRVVYDAQLNTTISKNKYTVKKPVRVEYSIKYL